MRHVENRLMNQSAVHYAAKLRAGLACLCFVCMTGCAGTTPPSVRLALDGPALILAGELNGRAYEGLMDRHAMAGVGALVLHEQGTSTVCRGSIDRPASQKGRLYLELTCSDGRSLPLILRNLGPDQGMGIGRLEGQSGRMTLFYHPCGSEAKRRLEQLRHELDALDPDAQSAVIKAPSTPAPAR